MKHIMQPNERTVLPHTELYFCRRTILDDIRLRSPLLDVLTPLSDCKRESVEKMDRRILGVSYMCGMDLQQRDFVLWVFMCPNNITLFFDSIFASTLCLLCVSSTATTARATTPHLYCKGYHAFTTARLPRLCIYIPATTPQFRAPFPGYHT